MNRLIAVLVLIIISFSFACSKSPKCWGDNKIKGEIIESISFPICSLQPGLNDGEYIIRDSSDLAIFEDCLPDDFEIDFNEVSILGRPTGFQCKAKFIREVSIDNSNKKYIYSITIKECGTCKSMGFTDNFVIVPAIPEDYSVSFDIEYK